MISFIVPAYNEERLLGSTLLAIRAAAEAAGRPYEVIVVDDGSSDSTAEVAASHDARILPVTHRQIAATRNAGAREAEGDLFFFVDADTLVDEVVLNAALRALHNGAVGGAATFRYDGRIPPYAKLLTALSVWVLRVARIGTGCVFFCTRQAFEAVGGFDVALYGAEDLALCRALKRIGGFVVLPQPVITSGRKLRAHSAWEAFRLLAELALRGRRSLRTPTGMLAIWYQRRREDPDART